LFCRLGQVQAVQRALLVRPEHLPGAQFAVHYVPVLEAGGDFYEVVDFGQGRAAYFLADVSGHDLGASFITSSLKALFYQHASPDRPPADTLTAMNRILYAITPEEIYLTALHLYVDRSRGTFALSAAGHPPVVACLGQNQMRFLDLPGSPLGLFDSVEFSSIEGQEFIWTLSTLPYSLQSRNTRGRHACGSDVTHGSAGGARCRVKEP